MLDHLVNATACGARALLLLLLLLLATCCRARRVHAALKFQKVLPEFKYGPITFHAAVGY
jgi:hypothetical protein